jgi:uncharacterized protein YdeI (YjbR/CyaY-like superfamily)
MVQPLSGQLLPWTYNKMKITKTLYVHKPKDWRAWLKTNHAKAREIWLVYYKKDSGKPRISYNDAVDEAICFGWIDSTAKTLDKKRYCQRFSPRRHGSLFSELNKARAKRLIQEGRMAPAGLESLKNALGGGARLHRGKIRETRGWKVPDDIRRAMEKVPRAWGNFRKFPVVYQRIRVAFVEGARNRPGMFKTRLNYLVKMSALNKRFGMLQKLSKRAGRN